ncbi:MULTISPECIES: transcriptional regulator [Epilithonimonas]|uniref:transcriptional regulator n=2 Tax=Chryseobacterium group TaxID=2782232 RepID=UPI002625E071|nr:MULTISPECIES: transcriptional regulator [Epilithonimonas]
MNYIRHLTGFYDRIQEDDRLNPTHISLYLALFQFWNLNHFRNPISISRNEMMKLSKISAYGTYHKCIKELHQFGYIDYLPSFNPYKGSLVHLFNFGDLDKIGDEENFIQNQKSTHSKNERESIQKSDNRRVKKQTGSEQAMNSNDTKIDTGYEQALIPSKNLSNYKNFTKRAAQPQKLLVEENRFNSKMERQGSNIPPELWEVKMYFEEKDSTIFEAEKFFNHYESNGWLVGGNSLMKNWQASARKWLLNSKKYGFESSKSTNSGLSKMASIPKANHLNANIRKSYQEKL